MSSHPLGILRQYRELPRLLGPSFLVIGFLGRLPTSMVILGVLTLLTFATGSVGDAGIGSAALALSTAVAGPVIGRWTDRHGQRVPLLVLAPLNTAALVALVIAADAGASLGVLAALCTAVGLTSVPVGSLARVRWLRTAKTHNQTSAALGYESMADELCFVLGPAAVGLAASLADPRLPVLLAAGLVAVFVVAFALHRTAADVEPRAAGSADRDSSRIPLSRVLRAVAAPVAGMFFIGMFFGGTQTAVTAFAGEAGRPGAAGLVYALMGIGSALMALAVVALPSSVTLRIRVLVCGVGMAALTGAMAVVGSVSALSWLVLAVGFVVGPALVTLFTLAGRAAPTGGTAVAMTAMGSANVVGVAVSAAVAGRLADGVGPGAAFIVAASAGLALAFLAAFARVSRAVPPPTPAASVIESD